MLSKEDFTQIVKHTPLVSIDLIIENAAGEILLGWRSNLPAKGYWFVPGGRIRKDENFTDAFKRIFKAETGRDKGLDEADFLGIYEHLYPGENFAGESGFGTHYVVIAYRVKIEENLTDLPKEQHENYWWASLDDILEDPNVHQNTRNYFNGLPSFTDFRR